MDANADSVVERYVPLNVVDHTGLVLATARYGAHGWRVDYGSCHSIYVATRSDAITVLVAIRNEVSL